MVKSHCATGSLYRGFYWKLMAGAAIVVIAAGCTRTGKKDTPQKRLAAIDYSNSAKRPALKPNHPLHIAATKWARLHEKKPADATAALNYARTLKALGSKQKAVEVLARTYQINPGHPELASEYGRLALDLGRTQLAERLLNKAQRARGQTDWRVLSALGTVNAKRGDHKKAQSYYLAALRQKPDATSVFNNLSLSYALAGRVGDAEDLLKRAVAKGHNTRKLRQNLALVLGLQSKFGEAQKVAQADLNGDKVDNNVSFMRDMVKTTKVASAKPAKARTKRRNAVTADPVTTAALPKQQKTAAARKPSAPAPLPLRKPAAPVKVATAQTAQTAQPAQQSGARRKRRGARQEPVRKAPATKANVTTAAKSTAEKAKTVTASANTKAIKRDSLLPWKKKPAARARVQTAKLNKTPTGAPTNILTPATTEWSMSVTRDVAAASPTISQPSRKARKTFELPSPN